MTHHLAVYVGPTIVAPMACKFRTAGIPVTCEGTERIHVILDAGDSPESARTEFLTRLRDTHDTAFGITIRDIAHVRALDYATEGAYRIGL